MESSQAVNVRKVRGNAHLLAGKCIAYEVEDGYRVSCDGAVLCTVNGHKPRLFRSLDTVLRSLREMGITEFEVLTKKQTQAA